MQHGLSTSPTELGAATDDDWSRPDNRFVPLRARDLAAALAGDADRFGVDAATVRAFAQALEEVIDRETGAFGRRLTEAYARFNPDRETQVVGGEAAADPEEYEILLCQLSLLLDKANYEELDDVQIAQAVMRARSRNLTVRVDPSRVEFLRIWVRGRGETTKSERVRWKPWRRVELAVPVFKRMVVAARLKDDPHVILKLFKDIPEAEAEALLPHAEVTMTWWDQLKLLGTGAGTLGITVSKVLKIAIGFAALWKLAWILLVGLGTLGIRAVMGYRNARISRNWQRTQHLYFQNMGNNASALQLLVAKVKQEELKEVLLACLFLCRASDAPLGAEELSTRVEQYLLEKFGVAVDFDVDDALAKLRRLGLLSDADRLTSVDLDQATQRLKSLSGQGGAMSHLLEA